MPELVIDGDRRAIKAGRFRLVFQWTGVRWEHWLEHQEPERPRILAMSVEGDPDRDDPARVVSPAYQQLQFQDAGPIVQALLVGQSGPHHFSAVFAVEQGDDARVSIAVDVADRCRTPVEALASTYTVDARSDELVEASPSAAAWDFGSGRLTFAAISPAQVALAEAGRRATQIQALAGTNPGEATRRFLYQWRWEPDVRRGMSSRLLTNRDRPGDS